MLRHEANAWVGAEILGRLRPAAALPRLAEAVATWRPDVVVRESVEFAAAVAAERHDVPHARVALWPGAMEAFALDVAAGPVDELRRAHDLPGDPDARRLRESPFLTLFPASLEDHARPAPPWARRFRDPAWDRFAEADGDDARPLLYVTFGNHAAGDPASARVYAEALRAVEDFDGDVLLTLGRDGDPAAFGAPPPHVRVERWVDQTEVLGRATAVVCHGGGGSTMGALAAGVPLVAVPLFAEDQHVNAARVVAAGAGVAVGPGAEAIRAALATILRDPSYRAAARALAAEIAAHPSTDEAVAYLADGAGG
jgi:UDP:flavonoid glycosyltransferase YjiC (YdhE family)